MVKNIPKTGKNLPENRRERQTLPLRKCRKRSPRPVKTSAPWYCPSCLKEIDASNETGAN